jgi:large subunit ribosomal protein L3
MSIGLVGRKCGMTRIFNDDGTSVPVTVIKIESNRVTQLKNMSVQTVMSSNVYIGPSSSGRTGCSAGIAPAGSVNALRISTNTGATFTAGSVYLVGLLRK